MVKLIKGGVLGGLILFIWGAVSWMALPWHTSTLHKFKNEAEVEEVIAKNSPRSGVYILPNPHRHEPGASLEEMDRREAEGNEKIRKGPLIFVSARLGTGDSMGLLMAKSLAIQMAAALLVTWMASSASGLGYFRRVLFVTVFGLAAGVVGHLPHWNWWGFSEAFTMAEAADLVIGWLLAGLVIAKILEPKR